MLIAGKDGFAADRKDVDDEYDYNERRDADLL